MNWKSLIMCPKECVVWEVVKRKKVPWGHIHIIQNMCAEDMTRIKNACGNTEEFMVNVGPSPKPFPLCSGVRYDWWWRQWWELNECIVGRSGSTTEEYV